MIFQWSQRGSTGWRAVLASASLGTSIIAAAVPSAAQPRISENKYLRIASWNLADAAAAGVITREKPAAKSWRNTFGSERRIAAQPKFAGNRLQADVVLLQGVRSVREVRQIFPARGWKLILSRQVLKLGGGRLNQDTAVAGRQAITAVAVRYQLRLRVTALEHLDNLQDAAENSSPSALSSGETNDIALNTGEGGSASDTTTANQTGETRGELFPDGLALRIAYSGSVIWVVSAVLPSQCRTGPETCPPASRLKNWADGKRADGFGVVMGGQLAGTLREAGPNGVCANQEIVADRALQAETGADTVAGCIAFADVEGP